MKVEKKLEHAGRVVEIAKNKLGKHCVVLSGKGVTSKLPHMKGQPAKQFHGCFSEVSVAVDRGNKVLYKKG